MSVSPKYSTFSPRFWAAVIDGFVLWPLTFIDDLVAPLLPPGVAAVLWQVVVSASCILYSVLLHSRYGQTVGKMVMKVTVLDVGESRRPTLRQAAWRDCGSMAMTGAAIVILVWTSLSSVQTEASVTVVTLLFAFSTSAWFLLELITMAFDPKRRALHDHIAGTVVVRGTLAQAQKNTA